MGRPGLSTSQVYPLGAALQDVHHCVPENGLKSLAGVWRSSVKTHALLRFKLHHVAVFHGLEPFQIPHGNYSLALQKLYDQETPPVPILPSYSITSIGPLASFLSFFFLGKTWDEIFVNICFLSGLAGETSLCP